MTYPVIGLLGLAGSGKDTAADILVGRYGYTKVAFADPLREMARVIDPVVGWNYYTEFTSDGGEPVYYTTAVHAYGYDKAKEFFPELRRFLQRLGTEWGRNTQGEYYWIDQAVKRAVAVGGPVVFTDVRFPNEADEIAYGWPGVLIRVVRAKGLDGEGGTHPSETAMDGYEGPIHYILDNTQDIEHLRDGIDTIMADLKESGWTD